MDKTVSHEPDAAKRAADIAHYAGQLDVIGGKLRLAPEAISRGGAIAVAGLLAIPLAALAGPRRWAAYVLGGSLAVLGIVLFPWAFDHLSNAVSISQSRRLAAFLPIPFAVAGAAGLLGRLRLAGCLAAFGAGALLQLVYPGEFSYFLVVGGPSWPAWVAIAGAAAGLVVAGVVRRGLAEATPLWTAAVALSLVAPVGLAGMAYVPRFLDARAGIFANELQLLVFTEDWHTQVAQVPGLVHALRTEVRPGAVVFSDLETSYRIEGYAPVYVAAAPPAHVADTKQNAPEHRRKAVIDFLSSGSLAIPRRYHAGWIVVAKRRFDLVLPLPKAFEDGRFALYRLSSRP